MASLDPIDPNTYIITTSAVRRSGDKQRTLRIPTVLERTLRLIQFDDIGQLTLDRLVLCLLIAAATVSCFSYKYTNIKISRGVYFGASHFRPVRVLRPMT